MTNKIEKQFFSTFGIEPKINQVYGIQLDYHIDEYPQITDHILLELICITNQHEAYSTSTNIKNIQARTLRLLLRTEKFLKNYYGSSDVRYKKLVKQVQALFEESNEIL